MGKAKKRSFQKGLNSPTYNLTREVAVEKVLQLLGKDDLEADDLITLFGLSAEELLEAGASYEVVKSRKGILK